MYVCIFIIYKLGCVIYFTFIYTYTLFICIYVNKYMYSWKFTNSGKYIILK